MPEKRGILEIYPYLVARTGLWRKIFFKFRFFIFEGVSVAGRGFLGRDIRPCFREFPVYFQPLLSSRLCIWLDRVNRALGLAHATVDTLVRMDDEHIIAFIEAVDRTNFNTIGVFALDAIFINDVGHASFRS
jgi:hypothetical protein